MVIKCNDGKFREIMPASSAGESVTVNSFNISKAYCTHCDVKFSTRPTPEQKEIWRGHSCSKFLKR